MTNAESLFVGWFRPHPDSSWIPMMHGNDAASLLDRLLAATRSGDRAVLANGTDPNASPPAMRRRRF